MLDGNDPAASGISQPPGPSLPIDNLSIDETTEAVSIRAAINDARTVHCGNCGESATWDRGAALAMAEGLLHAFPELPSSTDLLASPAAAEFESVSKRFSIRCSTCSARVCFGCGGRTSTKPFGAIKGVVELCWHCDKERLIAVWVILCGYEDQLTTNELRSANAKSSTSRKLRPAGDNGIGYDDSVFRGASDWEQRDNPTGSKKRKRKESLVRKDPDDELVFKTMSLLTVLLPAGGPTPSTEIDNEALTVMTHMLLKSSIIDHVASLLRNDSLDDIAQRAWLYQVLLHFIDALAEDSATKSAILDGQRELRPKGYSLLKVSMNEAVPVAREGNPLSEPLMTCMRSLYLQCKATLESFTANSQYYENDGIKDQNMLRICRLVCDFMARFGPKTEELSDSSAREDESVWQEEHRMMDVPDETLLAHSRFHQVAKDTIGLTAKTGRMRAITRDIRILRTGLPPGIFVRYGNSRPDVMKILIVGPKDTPYENGLFDFDLFCDGKYPNTPPQMLFRTTGGVDDSLNPNLYHNGQVCLSLLGTWEGEPWNPGKSTILQLVISIQAMIFCDEPYCNEPEQGRFRGSEESMQYNRETWPKTVRWGMVDWLKEFQPEKPGPKNYHHITNDNLRMLLGKRGLPTDGKKAVLVERLKADDEEASVAPSGIWSEVIQRHFKQHGDEILTTLGKWIAAKPTLDRTGQLSKSDAPAFKGTGWMGKTLGEDSGEKKYNENEAGEQEPTDAATPKAGKGKQRLGGSTFMEKLKMALRALEQNVMDDGYVIDHGGDDDDDDDELSIDDYQ